MTARTFCIESASTLVQSSRCGPQQLLIRVADFTLKYKYYKEIKSVSFELFVMYDFQSNRLSDSPDLLSAKKKSIAALYQTYYEEGSRIKKNTLTCFLHRPLF